MIGAAAAGSRKPIRGSVTPGCHDPHVIYLDPWDPLYGTSEDAPSLVAVDVDPTVETARWTVGIPVPPPSAPRDVCLVDGVQLVVARGTDVAADDGDIVPLVFLSAAAGAVRCGPKHASLDPAIEVRHGMLAGGERTLADLVVPMPVGMLVFKARAHPCREAGKLVAAAGSIFRREAEGAVVGRLVREGCPLVITDGRVVQAASDTTTVVGLIKSQHATYLAEPAQRTLLTRLAAGERSPLLRLYGQENRALYAWYLRLATPRPVESPAAGLVRFEVGAGVGLEAAVALAAVVSAAVLPLASAPPDPRAPQNLLPVGGLERHLRRWLPHPRLARRAIELALGRTEEAA